MAVIDTRHLTTIAGENQRLIDTAKNLYPYISKLDDPAAARQMEEQIRRLLDISGSISDALTNAK